jgi:uncharacterized protein YceK
MNKKVIGIVFAVLSLSLSGCGTVCNFAGGVVHPEKEPRVYGGVIRDIEIISNATTAKPDNPPNMGKAAIVILAVALVDPIVSFVADTLTLPITIPIQLWRDKVKKNNEEYESDAEAETPGIRLDPPLPVDAK